MNVDKAIEAGFCENEAKMLMDKIAIDSVKGKLKRIIDPFKRMDYLAGITMLYKKVNPKEQYQYLDDAYLRAIDKLKVRTWACVERAVKYRRRGIKDNELLNEIRTGNMGEIHVMSEVWHISKADLKDRLLRLSHTYIIRFNQQTKTYASSGNEKILK